MALRAAFAAAVRAPLAERDRWALWAPVGFGAGIGFYFALPFEPAGWTALAPLGALLALAASRGRAGWTVAALAALAVSGGFAAAQLRAASIGPHMLDRPAGGVLTGVVEAVEARVPRPRIVLRDALLDAGAGGARAGAGEGTGEGAEGRAEDRAEDAPAPRALARARVGLLPGAEAPRVGERVALRVRLRPPPPPAAPGAYDFQRAAFFDRLSAVGYALGAPRVLESPEPGGLSLGLRLARYRADLSNRIRAAVPGVAGTVAAALLTGERGPVPEAALRAMRDSGLAHLLAISGLHMGLVAGIVFFGLRAALALSRGLALRRPIAKWAALGALAFAAAYLLLSGAAVPTQRAFLMTGLVLCAVLAGRRAISMRLVAWAALAILAVRPESLLSASFQMSFAAVAALVAVYEWIAARPAGERIAAAGPARRVARYLAALALTSLVANLATVGFAAFHFNRVACYGLAANMAAVPLTGLWIMPWGVLALALAPFGLEEWALVPMGWGLEALLGIAGEVSAWPGAAAFVASGPAAALPALALSGLWLCLWRGRWRLLGLAPAALAVWASLSEPPPRVWATADGGLFGVRTDDGRLLLSDLSRDRFSAGLWARRGGGLAPAHWREAPEVVACDGIGCAARLDGLTWAFALSGRAFAEDCPRADVLLTAAHLPERCAGPARSLGRVALWRAGGAAIRAEEGRPAVATVAGFRGSRPWSRPPGGAPPP